MKKKGRLYSIVLILAFFTFGVLPAHAATVGLYDWAFNVDGDYYNYWSGSNLDDIDGLVHSAFDFDDSTGLGTGLGTLEWTSAVAKGPEDHSFIALFDHEIDELDNTFFNEFGGVNGSPVVGQSWEIDEPTGGNIYGNVINGILVNANSVPVGSNDDVSMAMGWDFGFLGLGKNEYAKINLILSETAPDLGFYLSQTDPDSGASIYFSTTLEINDGGTSDPPNPVIPEPSTLFLMGLGLAGLLGIQRRKSSRKKV